MAHFVTFKLTITLYLLTVLLTILTSIPMLRHVLPKSECLLFVKVILTFLWFPIHARRSNKTKSIFLRRSKWQTKQHHCSTALLQVTFFHQPQIVYNQHCFSWSLPRIAFLSQNLFHLSTLILFSTKGGGVAVGSGYPPAETIRKIVFDSHSTPYTRFRVSIRCRDGCRCCW